MSEGTKDKSIFIGNGVTFKGSISAPNQAIISGSVEGDLVAKDVLIGASGVVSAPPTPSSSTSRASSMSRSPAKAC